MAREHARAIELRALPLHYETMQRITAEDTYALGHTMWPRMMVGVGLMM